MIDAVTTAAGSGHNQAAPDAEIADQVAALQAALPIEQAALVERADELLASAAKMPATVADVETAGKFTDTIKMINACIKAADAAREERKAPFRLLGNAVQQYFRQEMIDPLFAARRTIETALGIYQRSRGSARVRGDYGALAIMSGRMTGEVTDRALLDLEALRPHLSLEALNVAVRAFVRAGGRELDGANIHPSDKPIVR